MKDKINRLQIILLIVGFLLSAFLIVYSLIVYDFERNIEAIGGTLLAVGYGLIIYALVVKLEKKK